MARQNRVDPYGQIIAVPSRGTLMGNRGVLHNGSGSIKRLWHSKAWITCLLDFKDKKRKIMSPGKYTELFFLDEATSFAAGHRPCSTCRHQEFKLFKSLWQSVNYKEIDLTNTKSISNIDIFLHSERVRLNNEKNTYKEVLGKLPDGTIISFPQKKYQAYLVFKGFLLEWSPYGYKKGIVLSSDSIVTVLTPKSIVNTFLAGYISDVHFSAYSLIS